MQKVDMWSRETGAMAAMVCQMKRVYWCNESLLVVVVPRLGGSWSFALPGSDGELSSCCNLYATAAANSWHCLVG